MTAEGFTRAYKFTFIPCSSHRLSLEFASLMPTADFCLSIGSVFLASPVPLSSLSQLHISLTQDIIAGILTLILPFKWEEACMFSS